MTNALEQRPTSLLASSVYEQLPLFRLPREPTWFEPSEPPRIVDLLLALILIVLPWSLIGWMIYTLV